MIPLSGQLGVSVLGIAQLGAAFPFSLPAPPKPSSIIIDQSMIQIVVLPDYFRIMNVPLGA